MILVIKIINAKAKKKKKEEYNLKIKELDIFFFKNEMEVRIIKKVYYM